MAMTEPQTLLVMTVGAFVLGWLVAKVSGWLGNRLVTKERDPRDDRIRSLEAELRIARSEAEKLKDGLEERDVELRGLRKQRDDSELHLKKQGEVLHSIQSDLRDSVRKTHELREELSQRATENRRSEVKLREVEAELSVAQASTDMLATGVLDYGEDDDEAAELAQVQQSTS